MDLYNKLTIDEKKLKKIKNPKKKKEMEPWLQFLTRIQSYVVGSEELGDLIFDMLKKIQNKYKNKTLIDKEIDDFKLTINDIKVLDIMDEDNIVDINAYLSVMLKTFIKEYSGDINCGVDDMIDLENFKLDFGSEIYSIQDKLLINQANKIAKRIKNQLSKISIFNNSHISTSNPITFSV